MVWPNAPTSDNPRGEYTETVIMHHQVRIQGVGPGGFDSADVFVPGSIIDGAGFNPDNASGTNWVTLLSGLNSHGDLAVPDAADITVLDDTNTTTRGYVPSSYYPMIDGFTVTGGSQSDFATNIVDITGGTTTPSGGAHPVH